MTYNELLIKLKNNHLYPSLLTRVKKNETILEGLELTTSPLLKDQNIDRVKEIVGEGFSVDYISTNETIQIKMK